ncbi:bacteriocin immunity protein [Pseudomonas sp. SIMBA_077]
MKKTLSDYSEAQFTLFMQEIFTANNNGTHDEVLDEHLDQFRWLTAHPAGSDLIYWSEDESQCTPKGITKAVKEWRQANGLPGFKPCF